MTVERLNFLGYVHIRGVFGNYREWAGKSKSKNINKFSLFLFSHSFPSLSRNPQVQTYYNGGDSEDKLATAISSLSPRSTSYVYIT